MEETIEVAGLRKRFGRTVALDGMSFTVRPGQVTGFVGPNGAGKPVTELRHSFAARARSLAGRLTRRGTAAGRTAGQRRNASQLPSRTEKSAAPRDSAAVSSAVISSRAGCTWARDACNAVMISPSSRYQGR